VPGLGLEEPGAEAGVGPNGSNQAVVSVLICTPYSANEAMLFQVWNRLICLLSTGGGSVYL